MKEINFRKKKQVVIMTKLNTILKIKRIGLYISFCYC